MPELDVELCDHHHTPAAAMARVVVAAASVGIEVFFLGCEPIGAISEPLDADPVGPDGLADMAGVACEVMASPTFGRFKALRNSAIDCGRASGRTASPESTAAKTRSLNRFCNTELPTKGT